MVLRKQRILLESSAILGAALLLFFAGCGLFSGRESGLVFNHKVHTDQGMGCDSCHEDYEYEFSAGMPAFETCLACHGEKSDREPYPYEAEIQKRNPEETWPTAVKFYDLKFSHALHVEKEVECVACHGDIATATEVSSSNRPEPETCMSCHQEHGLSKDDCTICHQNIRKDVKPRTHGTGVPNTTVAWKKTHGRSVVEGYNDRGHTENCQLCHSQSSCDSCHRFEKPDDHTESFRVRNHGSYASMDRDRCMACHQESFCVRCHRETTPRSHYGAGWGGTQANHCLYCHIEGGDSGCSVCHKSSPSHMSATPIPPPPHAGPSADCRRCHLRPPHADNGLPCTACHRR